MNILGDIERLVADVWPYRVPIAIALVLVLVVVGLLVWRKGWYRAATSRPRLSLAVVAVMLIVGLPIAWLLGSPLIIRNHVEEAPPVAAAQAGGTLLAGEFEGADEFHFGSGQAKLIETAPGTLVLRLEEFSVLNGPDLFVYLSSDAAGWTEEAVLLGGLKGTDGSFSYDVPAGVDAADVGSAVIWCRAFGVLFATAVLEPVST